MSVEQRNEVCPVRRRDGRFEFHGGRSVSVDGYVYMNGNVFGGSRPNTREHVVVAERALGKPLPKAAVVHHVNDDRADNRPSNLVICESQAYHMRLHAMRRLVAFGGRSGQDRRCHACHVVKPVTEFSPTVGKRRQVIPASKCKPCAAAWQRELRQKKRDISWNHSHS